MNANIVSVASPALLCVPLRFHWNLTASPRYRCSSFSVAPRPVQTSKEQNP